MGDPSTTIPGPPLLGALLPKVPSPLRNRRDPLPGPGGGPLLPAGPVILLAAPPTLAAAISRRTGAPGSAAPVPYSAMTAPGAVRVVPVPPARREAMIHDGTIALRPCPGVDPHGRTGRSAPGRGHAPERARTPADTGAVAVPSRMRAAGSDAPYADGCPPSPEVPVREDDPAGLSRAVRDASPIREAGRSAAPFESSRP
jgi:hypothetical protein